MRDYRKRLILLLMLMLGGIMACSRIGDGGAKPVVEIVSPPSGSRVATGQELEVQFQATDTNAVTRVELQVEGEIVDTETSLSPDGQPSLIGFLRWTPTVPGSYRIMVYAYNSEGSRSTGVGIEIEVTQGMSSASPTPSSEEESSSRPANLLYEEDFSDPSSGWAVGDGNTGSVGYRDGYYFVACTQENWSRWGGVNQSFGDMTVEVEATRFSGPANGNDSYGVQCRVQPNNDAYYLLISGDGSYSIQKIVDGSREKIVDWTPSDAINQGNAANHLRAVCDDSELSLYCNGRLLAEVSDSTYVSGAIALMVATYEPEAIEVHFDNLRVYAPVTEALPTAAPSMPIATPEPDVDSVERNETQQIGPIWDSLHDEDFSMQVTLEAVDWLGKDTHDEPKPGHVFVIVHLKLVNLGPGASRSVSSSDFQILDANGALRSYDLLSAARDCRLESVDLMVDGSIEGCIGFEIPDEGRVDLIYAPFRYEGLEPGRYLSFNLRP
jgi:hypothetical protein